MVLWMYLGLRDVQVRFCAVSRGIYVVRSGQPLVRPLRE